MASKSEETPQEEMLEKEGPETLPDSPLDLSDPPGAHALRQEARLRHP
jgi:hypothetical protein